MLKRKDLSHNYFISRFCRFNFQIYTKSVNLFSLHCHHRAPPILVWDYLIALLSGLSTSVLPSTTWFFILVVCLVTFLSIFPHKSALGHSAVFPISECFYSLFSLFLQYFSFLTFTHALHFRLKVTFSLNFNFLVKYSCYILLCHYNSALEYLLQFKFID